MDELLMLYGEAHHCTDCGTTTVFVPVEHDSWTCTACDAAVCLGRAA